MECIVGGKPVRVAIGSAIPIEAALEKLEGTVVRIDDVAFLIEARITIVNLDLHSYLLGLTVSVNCNDIRYTLFRLESSKIRLNLAIFDDLNM